MLLKRQYERNKDGKPLKVSGIKIQRAKARQHFTPSFIDGGVAEGWLRRDGDKIILGSGKEAVTYVIAHPPGMYCCHCDEPVSDGAAARAHIEATHKGASPDPSNPAGYRQDNFFACILQGKEVDTLSREQAIAMNRKIREAFHKKLGDKYRK
jgi:hypothetical protein